MNTIELCVNKLKWELLFLRFKLFGKKISLTKYYDKPVLAADEGNKCIRELLLADEPAAICRIGYNELISTVECMKAEMFGKKRISSKTMNLMCNNAGFFPANSEKMFEFSKLMRKVLPEVDLLGVWNNKQEDLVVKEFMKNTKICELRGLEPYYFDEPWSIALKGKRVLVIHPFSSSILSQYQHRDRIFRDTTILPEFSLTVLKAVQTAAGENDERFSDWFEALDYMYEEAMKIDFDIAIIGCGAYGLPLAVRIKQAGKKAIHMGGATQILFGIKGKRWDAHPFISQLYNENWIRPMNEERPKGSSGVEKGCYW